MVALLWIAVGCMAKSVALLLIAVLGHGQNAGLHWVVALPLVAVCHHGQNSNRSFGSPARSQFASIALGGCTAFDCS